MSSLLTVALFFWMVTVQNTIPWYVWIALVLELIVTYPVFKSNVIALYTDIMKLFG